MRRIVLLIAALAIVCTPSVAFASHHKHHKKPTMAMALVRSHLSHGVYVVWVPWDMTEAKFEKTRLAVLEHAAWASGYEVYYAGPGSIYGE